MKIKLINTEKILKHLQNKIDENKVLVASDEKTMDVKKLNKTQVLYMGKYIAYEEIIDFMKDVFESNKV